jgi:pyridoxamine 5'-phosphate oxidase
MTIPIVENPVGLFNEWLTEAEASELNDASATCLATTTADGRPSARMVLLKRADERGFIFYTNLGSRKGQELAENPHAAFCFHWKSLRRQVRVEGAVEPVSEDEADSYFATRDRRSQIGAWASKQSTPLTSPFELERRAAAKAAKYGLGEVPRPSFWSGFRIVPTRIEFWFNGAFRLHDRLVYERESVDDTTWRTQRLFP